MLVELPTSGIVAAVAAAAGDESGAIEALATGEAALRATDMMLELAMFLYEKAVTLQLLGRVSEAGSAAREALDLFERKEHIVVAGWVSDFIEHLL